MPKTDEMKKFKYLTASVLLTMSFAIVVKTQTDSVQPTPKVVVVRGGNSVEKGVFTSINGKFSIAIPEIPMLERDLATEKSKAKGIDVGKQFFWVIEKTLYTLYYKHPFDTDGNPSRPVYSDLENGTRIGILNGRATLVSEKPIKLGSYRGTEFRSVDSIGVKYIARVYLVGNTGYQLVGGYADEKDEKAVIATLDSFKPLKGKP